MELAPRTIPNMPDCLRRVHAAFGVIAPFGPGGRREHPRRAEHQSLMRSSHIMGRFTPEWKQRQEPGDSEK